MAKSNLEIYNIHRVISSMALDRLVRPHFADQRYIQKFVDQGFIKNSSGSVIFGIEISIQNQIKQLSQEFYLRLSDKEIRAWADLYSIILTPYDESIRDECLRVISIYEISFESLYMFFLHWVKIQYPLLSRDKDAAIDMINNKLDMFSLTCSTPIPEYMRNIIIAFVMQRTEKLINSKEPSLVKPCNMLFHVSELSHPDELQNVLPHVLAGIFSKKHMQPTLINKDHEITPSMPLILCLISKGEEDVIKPLREIDFSGMAISVNQYRVACCAVIPSVIRLIMKGQETEEGTAGETIASTFPYTPYIGFLSDFSSVCTYGFDFSFSLDNGQPVLYYKAFPLHPEDFCDDLADLVQNLAFNVYESMTLNVQNSGDKGMLIYKFLRDEHIHPITMINIRKFCRIFKQPLDEEAVYQRAVSKFEEKYPIFLEV